MLIVQIIAFAQYVSANAQLSGASTPGFRASTNRTHQERAKNREAIIVIVNNPKKQDIQIHGLRK